MASLQHISNLKNINHQINENYPTIQSLTNLGSNSINVFRKLENSIGPDPLGVTKNYLFGEDSPNLNLRPNGQHLFHPKNKENSSKRLYRIGINTKENQKKQIRKICTTIENMRKQKTYFNYIIPDEVLYYELDTSPPNWEHYHPNHYSHTILKINCNSQTKKQIQIEELYGNNFIIQFNNGNYKFIMNLKNIKHNYINSSSEYWSPTYELYRSKYEDTEITYYDNDYGYYRTIKIYGSFKMAQIVERDPILQRFHNLRNNISKQISKRKQNHQSKINNKKPKYLSPSRKMSNMKKSRNSTNKQPFSKRLMTKLGIHSGRKGGKKNKTKKLKK